MHRSPGTDLLRSFTLGPLLALALAACAGSGSRSPLDCATDAECPSAARCVTGACVANALPVAALDAPATAEAFVIVRLDGSASADPDAGQGDAVSAHAWSVSSLDAPCSPPVVAGTGPVAVIRFGCTGRHLVRLVVTDRMGAQSAPAEQVIEVQPSTRAPLVGVGPDVVTGHRCSGTPLRCAPDAVVTVTASAAPTGGGAIRYRWSAHPPLDRPLGADRRVSFLPGDDAPSPTVLIETDGAAISGDWLLQVEALDDAGVFGAGVVRVSVGNQPPVVVATDPGPVAHTFVAAESAFVAGGEIPVAVTDPDGDPVVRIVTFRHAGDGEGTFDGEDRGSALAFHVRVPYATADDALALIGGEGLERTVELVARDVNGAESARAFPVVIGNRPPVEVVLPAYELVPHSYDPVAGRYRASAVMSRWSDPDGDPLVQAAPTGDADCDRLLVLADGTAMIECSRAFTGSPAVAAFAVGHLVLQAIGDPWATTAQGPYQVRIDDRAPRATSTTSTVAVTCEEDRSTDLCCRYVGETCVSYPRIIPAVSYAFAPKVTDEDGDPLEVRLEEGTLPISQLCLPDQCTPVTRTLPRVYGCNAMPGGETTTFTVTDGVGSASATHTVTRTCK